MTIIQDFQALQTGEQIGLILAITSVLFIAVMWALSELDRQDIEWAARNPAPDSEERQQEIAAKHVSQRASSELIGGLLQLDEKPAPASSRPMPPRYSIEAELRAVEIEIQRQMAADTIKGKRP